jgi:hypothetical protein
MIMIRRGGRREVSAKTLAPGQAILLDRQNAFGAYDCECNTGCERSLLSSQESLCHCCRSTQSTWIGWS